jgi:hypothetical protein
VLNQERDFRPFAEWRFTVCVNEYGEVATAWLVTARHGKPSSGVTDGPLHAAIFDAYDARGITCPLVPDPDLLRWGGHDAEEGVT